MLSIIVAKAKNNTIGKDNKIEWFLPEDKKRVKELTKGKILIMGRKTFESLDEIWTDREYIVMTENRSLKFEQDNVRVAHSMLEIQQYIEDENENFVMGGAMIFNLVMPHVKKLYVTEIDKDFEGNAVFPKIKEEIWKEISRKEGPEDGVNNFKYNFVEYVRK